MYLAKDSAVGGVKITMPRIKDDYDFKQGGQGIYLEIPCKIVLSVADAPVGIYNESKKIPYNSSQELVLEDDWMRQYKNYRYIYPKEAYASVTTIPEKYLDWVVTTDFPSVFINTPTNPGRIPYVQVGLMFEFPYDNLRSPVSYYDPSGLTTNYANYDELYRKAKEYIFNNIYIALSQFNFQIK